MKTGIRLAADDLCGRSVPVDFEPNRLPDVPELHIVAAVDGIGLQCNPFFDMFVSPKQRRSSL